MAFGDLGKDNLEILLLLNLGSLMLIGGAVFLIQIFSVIYGVASGAIIQSSATGVNITPTLVQAALQSDAIHRSVLESYVVLVVALIAFVSSFTMFLRRYDRGGQAIRSYTMLHGAFTLIYILLFFVVLSGFFGSIDSIYIYIPYFGMGLCIICDVYLEYEIRKPQEKSAVKTKNSISIDPAKPFSNAVNLQDQLFGNMSGTLRIVDKHFNSSALVNLHRLLETNLSNFNSIIILTSKEMLDANFSTNLNDFRSELSGSEIKIEVKLMDDKDAIEQHERMMLDDKIAYKIPPLNIINKRSEHITKINFDETYRRFNYLYGRAITIENYSVKRAREEKP